MRKLLLLTFLLFTAAFTGCNNDDDDNKHVIEIRNVEGSDGAVTEVRAISSALKSELASASTKNKPIQLNLPGKVASKHLVEIGGSFSYHFDISDPDVLWSNDIYIEGYDASGELLGEFIQANYLSDRISQSVFHVYVEKDVTVEGSYMSKNENGNDVEVIIDYNLKAGWNIISQKLYYDIYESENRVVLSRVRLDNRVTGSLFWVFLKD